MFRIESLGDQDRAGFRCGNPELDRYFMTLVSQDIRRQVTRCFVAVEETTGTLAGFYTLAASGLPLTGLPVELGKRLPRYGLVPVMRVGRLAVDLRFQSRRLGSALLADAFQRAARSEAGVYALAVDAQDEAAARWYERFGFLRLTTEPLYLFLPMKTGDSLLV